MKLLKITLFASILGSATFSHSLSAIANTRFETIDITTLTNQAARGDYHAQFFLAKRLQKGEGVTKDASKAVYWYTRAAEKILLQLSSILASCICVEKVLEPI